MDEFPPRNSAAPKQAVDLPLLKHVWIICFCWLLPHLVSDSRACSFSCCSPPPVLALSLLAYLSLWLLQPSMPYAHPPGTHPAFLLSGLLHPARLCPHRHMFLLTTPSLFLFPKALAALSSVCLSPLLSLYFSPLLSLSPGYKP